MINAIKIKERSGQYKFKGKLDAYSIFIDQVDLFDHIAAAAAAEKMEWSHSSETVVFLEELHRSVKGSGSYSILAGSHCLMEGLKLPGDVNLEEVNVVVEDERVEWRFKVLDLDSNSVELLFAFHKSQLLKEVEKLPKKTVST